MPTAMVEEIAAYLMLKEFVASDVQIEEVLKDIFHPDKCNV